MRALFAKGVAQSSVLRKLDARTKLIVTATTAVLTVASAGMVFTCCCSSAPVWSLSYTF